mmetsp:Transcript_59589/g.72938  ORF Transcript_59589/g.72938 Transcript_59589/m.72938 type:complete len:530 (-) Transcript_59589:110-1699(-)
MRFGKLLAAVTQNSRADEPYVSYKELKHNLSKVSALCGKDDADNSSGDEFGPVESNKQEILESTAASSSSSQVAAASSTGHPKIVGPQQDFFRLLDQDLAASKLYVQSNVSGIEAMIGEWQVAAVKAGLIFTPQQLDEVRSQLPVHMEEEALVDWLLSLTPGAKAKEARLALVDKYSEVARLLNSLLQYVEVNFTAVRKILKKFDKKIPPEFRTRKVQDYKVHHELFMPAMQHVLVTAVQVQRLIAETVAESGDLAVPISQLGPESLAVLSCIQNRNVAVEDVFGYSKPGKIDVYAKPMSAAAAAGAVASRLASDEKVTTEPTSVKAKPVARPQQAGLVSKTEEDDDDDDAPEGQEPVLVGKSRRRGGRNNRKRGSGSRKDFEKSAPQPPQPQQTQPQPKGKGKGKRPTGEESVAAPTVAGPVPCEQNLTHETMKVPVPLGATQPAVIMQQHQMLQMSANVAQPRFTPMYGGFPFLVPKAGGQGGQGGGHAPPIAFGGMAGMAGVIMDPNCHANWMPVPMVWPQNNGPQ